MGRDPVSVEKCPTPEYHETHMYCPSCDWTAEKDDRPEEANGTVIQTRGKMIGSVPINSRGRLIR